MVEMFHHSAQICQVSWHNNSSVKSEQHILLIFIVGHFASCIFLENICHGILNSTLLSTVQHADTCWFIMRDAKSHHKAKIMTEQKWKKKKHNIYHNNFLMCLFCCCVLFTKRSLEIFSLLLIQCNNVIKMNLGLKLLTIKNIFEIVYKREKRCKKNVIFHQEHEDIYGTKCWGEQHSDI